MGYSDWDLCASDIDLSYEMANITFNNIRHNYVFVYQGISFIKKPAKYGGKTKLEVKVKSCPIVVNNIMVTPINLFSYPISFIVRKK